MNALGMNVTTETSTIVVIRIDEAAARICLADPSALLSEIRAVLKPIGEARGNGRNNLHLGKQRRDPKACMHPAAPGKISCAICGKSLKPRGMSLHMHRAHPAAAPAGTD